MCGPLEAPSPHAATAHGRHATRTPHTRTLGATRTPRSAPTPATRHQRPAPLWRDIQGPDELTYHNARRDASHITHQPWFLWVAEYWRCLLVGT